MKMQYIKGVIGRGAEVLQKLTELGGVNSNELSGENDMAVYYIADDNIIDYISSNGKQKKAYAIILKYGEEMKLDPKRTFKVNDLVHFTDDLKREHNGRISMVKTNNPGKETIYQIFSGNGIYFIQENRLSPWTPNNGDRVLVRNGKSQTWVEAVFSYKPDDDRSLFGTVGGSFWEECIPFELDMLGKTWNLTRGGMQYCDEEDSGYGTEDEDGNRNDVR